MLHTIHLRGGWVAEATNTHTSHARNFGRPRTLDANERLWLVCQRLPGPAEVRLNAEPIGTLVDAGPFATDITDVLRSRNALTFLIASGEPLGEVWLEVRTLG